MYMYIHISFAPEFESRHRQTIGYVFVQGCQSMDLPLMFRCSFVTGNFHGPRRTRSTERRSVARFAAP